MTNLHPTARDLDQNAFLGAFNEARQTLLRAGESVDVCEFGRRAWQQITPLQRAYALDGLFHAYWRAVHDEEEHDRRETKAASATSYLEPGDEDELIEGLLHQTDQEEGATVTILAASVANVLAELDLLRHRLEMARAEASDE
ncbi:hypothetical protein [Streptomyces sp. CB03911]|uniref:hypothetical protein n=1 Tax=Streptomyces sp. CB03911 TaxID=1804758 RepID=UPI000939B721|nr:hypothetical protein [Streptomyces sp. CB03911]OKI14169.1 hypothetical protein A6A07_13520 [Streptomyces sp. CB03911]